MSGPRFHRHWIACALLVPAAAGAHHSRTQYDGSEVQEIQGELIAVSWPLTPDVKITERLTVSEDQSALTYRQTVVDPATFTEPAMHESQHLALGESIERFVCAPEL